MQLSVRALSIANSVENTTTLDQLTVVFEK